MMRTVRQGGLLLLTLALGWGGRLTKKYGER